MRGISSIVSATVIIAVILSSTFVVLNTLKPSVEKSKDTAILKSGEAALLAIDKMMREVVYEAPGARRTIKLSITGGKLVVSGERDDIEFQIFPKSNIMQPGTVKKEGNLIISYGPSVKAYIADADNDGTDDYVLENNIITFAVKKLYSSSNQGEINMSDPSTKIVSLIENKMTNTVIHPTFKVSFNDDLNTMYGTGYTELVTNGDNLPEGIIKLHMECPNTKNHLKYEVVFTLYPGQDFVHVEVNKV